MGSLSIAEKASIPTGFVKYSIDKAEKLIEQARRQLWVANGTLVVWRVPSKEASVALIHLFKKHKIDIEVELFP
jgi:hypothetical protein